MLLWELELAFAQDATMAQLLVANWAEPMTAMSAGNLVALMAVTSVENSVELRDAQ